MLSNPPFGSKIVSADEEDRSKYELGYGWKYDSNSKIFQKQKLKSNVPPQILFLEKILRLLKEGGRYGLVMPESLLSSPS